MRKNIRHVSYLLCLSGLLSCKHGTDLSGAPIVSFKKNITPLISQKCSFNGCHSNTGEGAFSLVGYDNIIKSSLVKPGNATDSRLYSSITGKKEKPMPPVNNIQLTNDEVSLVYIWIEQGAAKN